MLSWDGKFVGINCGGWGKWFVVSEWFSIARIGAMDGSSIPGFIEQVLSSHGAGCNWATNGSRVAAGMPVTNPARGRAGTADGGGWHQPEQLRRDRVSAAAGIRGDSSRFENFRRRSGWTSNEARMVRLCLNWLGPTPNGVRDIASTWITGR